jgi:tetratricopeptide (TPR) repeat protein
MPEYILTAKSPAGSTVTERVDAPTADEAVLTLHERGYSEIQLHTDDVSALYSKSSEIPNLSPSEYLQHRRMRGRWASFLFVSYKLYREGWKMTLLFVVVLVVRRGLNLPWNWIDYVNIGLLLFPAIWAAVAQFLPHSSLTYDKLVEAAAWGRWQEVIDLIPMLDGKGIPPEELAFRHAQAVAGLGRLPEALQIVQPFSDGARMPEWLYSGRLAELYEASGQPLKIIPCVERAAELAPGNATVLLDLVMALLRNRCDVPRAKRLLEECRSHALSDMLIPFVNATEGVLALEENNNQRAKELFTEANQQLSVYASASALIGASLDRIHAFLAIAESRLGNPEAARKHFQQAEPRLRALGTHDLLQRCCEELRIPFKV